MKKIKILALAFATLLLVNTNTFAQCSKHEGKEGKGNCHVKNISDLTADQQTQMDKLKTTHMKTMMDIKNQIGVKNAELKVLNSADKTDMNAINAKIDEIGALKTQLMKKKTEHMQAIRAILTPEQRLKFDANCCMDDDSKGCGSMGKSSCKSDGNSKGDAKCSHSENKDGAKSGCCKKDVQK